MINRKLAKVLSRQYIVLAAILILLAVGLVLLPKQKKHEGIDSKTLLSNIISPERYISTDELADKMINQDPSFLLIDIRDSISSKKNSLPNAINIPLKKIVGEDAATYLDQDQFDIVLFSNEHYYADQAWILCNRLGYKNIRVLKGGINEWFNTIINPPKPTENMPATAFELYSFRKAASMYFGVAYPDAVKKTVATPKKRVRTVKKKKKKKPEGGC